KDAMDKAKNIENRSSLTNQKRIQLALLSYIELITNYAILFYVMPVTWFDKSVHIDAASTEQCGSNPSVFGDYFDAIYFSGVSITTLGYGDYSPAFVVPKLLVIHEVLAGFTLIIVSFAIYAGNQPNQKV
ncbi:MAG: potassium channel family protein, partial [Gammaproteobacteria bacterium]